MQAVSTHKCPGSRVVAVPVKPFLAGRDGQVALGIQSQWVCHVTLNVCRPFLCHACTGGACLFVVWVRTCQV